MRRLLFVTWDGPGQSYLPSLFFPIFSQLSALGYGVDVLQHTTATQASVDETAKAAVPFGVRYGAHRVAPHWGRLALPAIIVNGARRLVRVARQQGIEALFPRSLIPAAMALLACRLAPHLRLVFDADGLMADERVDFAGLSPSSPLYRLLRDAEAEATRKASAVIVRTSRARAILAARAGAGTSEDKIFVVPNGKDAALFAPRDADSCREARAARGIDSSAPWLVYVGSLGPQYFPEAMLRLAAEVQQRSSSARLTLFTRHQAAASELLRGAGVRGVDVDALSPERVPQVLAAADLGIALRATTFSQAAVSPIKVAEYLLCGTPVVASPAGDLAVQLADCAGALLLARPGEEELRGAARWFTDDVLPNRDARRSVSRARALQLFSLETCVQGYAAALTQAFVQDAR